MSEAVPGLRHNIDPAVAARLTEVRQFARELVPPESCRSVGETLVGQASSLIQTKQFGVVRFRLHSVTVVYNGLNVAYVDAQRVNHNDPDATVGERWFARSVYTPADGIITDYGGESPRVLEPTQPEYPVAVDRLYDLVAVQLPDAT